MVETLIFFKVKNFKIRKKFVIIISNAFTLKWLTHLIRSLNIQKCKDSFAVIIVDYGNDFKELIDLAKKCDFDVIVISLKNVYGTANQRNIGVFIANKYIQFDYSLFIDSDIVILDRSFFCKLKYMIEKVELPSFTHVLFNHDRSAQWSYAELIGPFLVEFKNTRRKYSAFLHGAFFSLKYDIIAEVLRTQKYLFHPIFLISFDDYFLSLVLHRYNMRYFPVLNVAKVIHFGGSSMSRVSEKRLREAVKNLTLCFYLSNKTRLLIGIIPEYMIYSLIRCLLNTKLNIINIIKNLIQGLVLGLLYIKLMKTKGREVARVARSY
jgi:hypothetical protein